MILLLLSVLPLGRLILRCSNLRCHCSNTSLILTLTLFSKVHDTFLGYFESKPLMLDLVFCVPTHIWLLASHSTEFSSVLLSLFYVWYTNILWYHASLVMFIPTLCIRHVPLCCNQTACIQHIWFLPYYFGSA